MKIEIKNTEELEVVLDDIALDNDNFVDISLGKESTTVPLDDLLSAVSAFQQKRVMRITREDNYRS